MGTLCEGDRKQAGADAIELNTYALATDRSQTSAELELQLLELVDGVCRRSRFRSPSSSRRSFTSIPHLVQAT